MVNSLIYKSIPKKVYNRNKGISLTLLKEKIKTLIFILFNIKGNYNIKEIIRDKLNKRTSVYILFLK